MKPTTFMILLACLTGAISIIAIAGYRYYSGQNQDKKFNEAKDERDRININAQKANSSLSDLQSNIDTIDININNAAERTLKRLDQLNKYLDKSEALISQKISNVGKSILRDRKLKDFSVIFDLSSEYRVEDDFNYEVVCNLSKHPDGDHPFEINGISRHKYIMDPSAKQYSHFVNNQSTIRSPYYNGDGKVIEYSSSGRRINNINIMGNYLACYMSLDDSPFNPFSEIGDLRDAYLSIYIDSRFITKIQKIRVLANIGEVSNEAIVIAEILKDKIAWVKAENKFDRYLVNEVSKDYKYYRLKGQVILTNEDLKHVNDERFGSMFAFKFNKIQN